MLVQALRKPDQKALPEVGSHHSGSPLQTPRQARVPGVVHHFSESTVGKKLWKSRSD